MDALIAEADEKQEFVMQDEDARDYYDRRQKAEWDRVSDLNGTRLEGKLEGVKEGKLEGLQEGRLEGLQEGRLEERMELLALIDKGYTAEDIKRELAARG